MAAEYNDNSKYNEDAYPRIRALRGSDPSKFASDIDWQKACEVFKTCVKEYEYVFNNWKKSGNHGDFGDAGDADGEKLTGGKPFSDFIQNNNYLLYFHEFVYQYPGILSKISGDLPEWAFRESMGRQTSSNGNSKKSSSDRKKRGKSKTSGASNPDWDAYNYKNLMISSAVASESVNQANESINNLRNQKRQLKREGEDRCGGGQEFKRRHGEYETSKKRAEDKNGISDDDSSLGDLYGVPDSQESLFREMYDVENELKDQMDQRDYWKKKSKSIQKAEGAANRKEGGA